MSRYCILTFGCQMNQHDSERIAEVLSGAGLTPSSDPEESDLVLLNTCSVREKAEQKLRSEVGRLRLMKKRRPNLTIAVAGCVAQQEGERLMRSLPQIDLIIGPDNIPELPGLLDELAGGGPPRVRTAFDLESPRFLRAQPVAGRQAPSAFVTTMKGCDERCSFCIVPTTRGPERYRPSGEILDEVGRLVAAGAREITLLGQTVDSYLDPLSALTAAPGAGLDAFRGRRGAGVHPDESEFPALLRAIAAGVPELERLRYTSPHPRHLTPSLVEAHRDLPVLAKHVHMPVQSGSDRLLKRMVRRYTRAEYLERTGQLRAAVPGLTLSTDIIVGFPGETREDFEATLSLMREVGFVSVFAFKYSERPGTPSVKLGDDVTEAEKSARLAELFELSESLRSAYLKTLVGSEQRVLVEGRGKKTDAFSGRTERNEIVHFGFVGDPIGQFVNVRVTRAFKHSLEAEAVDEARRRAVTETPRAAGSGAPNEDARPRGGATVTARRALPVV
jgi:tRNA-2-methylthio-N6-dimethylallyladenosine synthase